MTAQILSMEYDKCFSDYIYGFRPGRNCQQAVGRVLKYLSEGCEWIIDLDIEKFFDTVNHDKLISIGESSYCQTMEKAKEDIK